MNTGPGELVDHVDAHDRVLGTVDRATAARRGLLHRVAGVVVLDARNRYLVHRRTGTATWFGGMYAALLGGAVRAGETYVAAAARETLEETGLDLPVRYCFKFLCRGEIGPYWFAVHEAVLPPGGRIAPRPGEFASIDWLDEEQLRRATTRLPFIPEVQDAFARYRRHGRT